MSGSTAQVSQTSHIATIIGAIGLVACMLVFAVALGVVIVHDGNTSEVNTAMGIVGDIGKVMAGGIVVMAGAAGAVSAFVSRPNQASPASQPPTTPPAPSQG